MKVRNPLRLIVVATMFVAFGAVVVSTAPTVPSGEMLAATGSGVVGASTVGQSPLEASKTSCQRRIPDASGDKPIEKISTVHAG